MTARLFTIPDVADRLGVARSTVYDLIARGELRVVDLGHGRAKSRVREDDLAQFIDRRTHTAATQPA